jgi:uncharacterized membrane protein (TIGR02234 family)
VATRDGRVAFHRCDREEEYQGMAGSSSPAARSRRELVAVLLAGVAGATVILLATRQVLARVRVLAPRPLPASVTPVTGQDLRPAIAALAIAALASLAAVLATRGLLRRITGLITVALAVGIAILAIPAVTQAQVLSAARSSGATPAAGSGAGTAPGSVTAGSGGGGTGGFSLAGFPVRVDFGDSGWRAVMIIGAVLLVAAGIVVLIRASRLPAMSARYERPARQGDGPASGGEPASEPSAGPVASAGPDQPRIPAGSAMWESLSAGEDPTAWPE